MKAAKKDFQAVADMIRTIGLDYNSVNDREVLGQVADRMADIFAGSNRAFDRDKFMVACGCFDDAKPDTAIRK